MTKDPAALLPLSPAGFHIMMALASEDRHGYGIMQDVARHSDGGYKLGPGTLYGNLQKMMNQGLIEEAISLMHHDDPRRRYYRLTRFGRSVLSAEVTRLERVVRQAKLYLRPAAGVYHLAGKERK